MQEYARWGAKLLVWEFVDFGSGDWVRNAYMSLAMSLAISLVTLWLRDGRNGRAVSREDSCGFWF
jgi:hypothetical protein